MMMAAPSNSGKVGKDLSQLEKETQANPGDQGLLLEYAKALHADGQIDQAFMAIKRSVALNPNNKDIVEAGRDLLAGFMSKMSVSREKFSPENLSKVLLASMAEAELTDAHVEAAEYLLRFTETPSVKAQLLKFDMIHKLFQVALSPVKYDLKQERSAKFLYLVTHSLVNLITACDSIELLLKEAGMFDTLALDKWVSILGGGGKSASSSSFLNVSSLLFQKCFPFTDADSQDANQTENVTKFFAQILDSLLASGSVDSSDMLVSFLLKVWPNRPLCQLWISDTLRLEQLVDMCCFLVAENKISSGHFSILFGKLFQSAKSAEFGTIQTSLLKIFERKFGGDVLKKSDAMCMLGALFNVNAEMAGKIFGKEGVLDELMDCLEFESDSFQSKALELFSDACADKSSRLKIRAYATEYLDALMRKFGPLQAPAAVVLSKLATSDQQALKGANVLNVDQTAPTNAAEPSQTSNANMAEALFIQIIDPAQKPVDLAAALEGLAYLSGKAEVKEKIQNNPALFLRFEKIVKASSTDHLENSIRYGIALVLDNITAYKRKDSDEEQQIRKLRELAKEVLPEKTDARDTDEGVKSRILKLLGTTTMLKVLVLLTENSSVRVREHLARCWVSLATEPSLRGKLVQAGAVKSLLYLADPLPVESNSAVPIQNVDEQRNSEKASYDQHAAQALAKIAISMDPHIAFPTTAPSMIRPLLSLLEQDVSTLFQFEALLALTNLASMEDSRVGQVALTIRHKLGDKKALRLVEDRILSENMKVQGAAVELLCNLLSDDDLVEGWLAERGATRVKILLALTDAEELSTRRATCGSLAMLTQNAKARALIMENERVEEYLVDVLESEDMDIVWRGLFVWTGLCQELDSARQLVAKNKDKFKGLFGKFLAQKHDGVASTCKQLIGILEDKDLKLF